jgi:hypothetical protein
VNRPYLRLQQSLRLHYPARNLALALDERKTHSMKNRNIIFTTILLGLACFALLPGAQALTPAPDGCYPNFTTAEGCDALNLLGAGVGNTAVGWRSLFSADDANFNTGVGAGTLLFNTGDSNTAVGAAALLLNTSGTENVAVGTDALVFNTTGDANTATGAFALFSNTEGANNTATGDFALSSNTTGSDDTATGHSALQQNTTGFFNTAVGSQALLANTTGDFNTANGGNALLLNNGVNNTATGYGALEFNTDGGNNTAMGIFALQDNTTGGSNTAVGSAALASNATGGDNTALGNEAGSLITGSGNVCIGAGVNGVAGESNLTRIRNVYASVATERAVYVTSDNRIGTLSSSRRYKEGIKPMNEASEALFALKPVTFRYKKAIDPTRVLSFGLIAEDVAEISPELITRDKEGKPETVRYEAVNAMLLNEFLKEHKKLGEQQSSIAQLESNAAKQEATITQLEKEMKIVVARLREHDSKIQKADAHMEMDRSALKMVANDQ